MKLPYTIGRFELLELLGTGGSGAVYAARQHGDMGIDHDVAVKVFRGLRPELGGVAGFRDEARLLSRLAHPNVVPIRELTTLEDETLGSLLAIVMPLVRGRKLSTLLREQRAAGRLLPLGATFHLLMQAADALQHVHEATDVEGAPLRIVHRDLKPSNLMVTPQGDLRMLDFGIAWAAERSVEATQGLVKGTLRYLSPEQLQGLEPDGRSDLYAFGVVAWEMVCGERFVVTSSGSGGGTAAMLGALLRTRLPDRLPALRDALVDVHRTSPQDCEHITDLLVRLLQPDPERRFPTARALCGALDRFADRWPVRSGRRYLAAVVAGDEDGARAGLVPPESPPTAAESPSVVPGEAALRGGMGRGRRVTLAVVALAAVVAAVLGGSFLMGRSTGVPRSSEAEKPAVDPDAVAAARELTPRAESPSPVEAPEGDARTWIAAEHRRSARGDWSIDAELQGERSSCRPRLVYRSDPTTDDWTVRSMGKAGHRGYRVVFSASEVRGFRAGVDYWIRCDGRDGEPVTTWQSAESPAWFDPTR